jgi:hypothetical protein
MLPTRGNDTRAPQARNNTVNTTVPNQNHIGELFHAPDGVSPSIDHHNSNGDDDNSNGGQSLVTIRNIRDRDTFADLFRELQLADSDNHALMSHLRDNSDDDAPSNTHNTNNTQIEAASAARENNIWDGDSCVDRPLTWSLYEQFNEWFIALDNGDGVFAAEFSKATIATLAWRSSKTATIPLFAPRSIQKFRRIVSQVCKNYKQIILEDFGFDIKDIGLNSWRRLARLQELSKRIGSTATAVYTDTGAAVCIRGGWSMGRNRDVYISHHVGLPSETACIRGGHLMGRNRDVYIEYIR